MEARFCTRCGTTLPPGARFCPKCGTTVAQPVVDPLETVAAYVPPAPEPEPAPQPAPVPEPPPRPAPPPVATPAPPPGRSRLFLGVILAMIAVAVLIWLLLMGMPFGRRETAHRVNAPKLDTIAEAPPPRQNTATLVEEEKPRPAPAPAPAPTRPPVATEISQSEAVATLASYVRSAGTYDVASDCIDVTPQEYANRGYTLEVVDRCNSRPLGRWRIDSLTREVYRQREDGRYLRP